MNGPNRPPVVAESADRVLARAVALGGGHGQARTLLALTQLATHVTAIATVADDGGSSGRLRRELGVLPPGDLRMALSTLTEVPVLQALVEHRFSAGSLEGHSLGNLIILALAEIEGGFTAGLATLARLLGIAHAVLPSTETDVHLAATGPSGATIVGQASIANTAGVTDLRLVGGLPIAAPAAVAAIEAAELIVLGPGSVCTSLVPNLLVPGIAAAVVAARAPVLLVGNLDEQDGEGEGRSVCDHLDMLEAAAPGLRIDHVLMHQGPLVRSDRAPMAAGAGLATRAPELVCADLVDATGGHDPTLLAAAIRRLVT
ncbi:MAG: putative cofD-like protein [Nitriliruptoraceae bacterium]|jgi:uncharacterized cofD-like protein